MMKKYILLSISAILLVIIVLAIPGKDSFLLDANDIIDKIGSHEYIFTADQLSTLQDKENTILLDMNTRENFMDASLPGSVNLPLDEFNLKTIHEFFKKPAKYVIYHKETSSACNAWMLLTQMGYENIFVLKTD